MSSSQTPFPSTFRRPSFTNYTSPLQHASLVGSYEESILRGRMSTNPSKPLDFLAQIGVLGLGAKCKPSLRCPAHVTLPFTAVFYSYATTSYSRSKAEDGPSPYVGLVDLENGLPNLGAEQRSKRKAVMPSRRMSLRTRASQTTEPKMNDAVNAYDAKEPTVTSIPDDEDVTMGDMRVERLDLSEAEGHKSVTSASRSHKRRPHGIRAPPGGSYRIPEQGQIQIIIKNQNKTAVKLFLIPYNLKDMEPGKKTFIRQRSYSAGPIIDDMPVTSGASLERPVLRYLIHLHICCPSRGRYYLYKSIRVVFANRVPDGKENLRNELSFPEPLYSPYKPVRVMPPTPSLPGGSGSHAVLAAEKAYRRRSSGFSFSTHGVSQGLDSFGIMHPPIPAAFPSSKLSKSASSASLQPWSYQKEGDTTALGHDGETVTDDRLFGSATPTKADNFVSVSEKEESSDKAFALSNAAVASNLPLYKKLSKGDIGYGGNAFVSSDNASCEGLLSQRLRTLEVKRAPSVDEN
ncbi:hypothetical protein SEPCBS57363_004234 [Sporothrix epigloea]|uniref:Atos-like conserved domain-containing protein n=1 Tax=Sporothrix epigloea TaxID=1892477 RepID=A0ABP0DQW4_9PEZI